MNPFLISILERVVYKLAFKFQQIYGMLAIVVCAVLLSLSEVFQPKTEEEVTSLAPADLLLPGEERTPVWVAVLSAFAMPVACTFFVIVIKYQSEVL